VLGLRYDSSEITQSLSEIVAYGTAVTLNPVAPVEAPADESVQPLTPPDGDETPTVEAPPDQAYPTSSGSSPYAPPSQSWPPPREP
jgi:hypothetical protein